MRTTLTLDPDVAVELERLNRQRREAFKQTVIPRASNVVRTVRWARS